MSESDRSERSPVDSLPLAPGSARGGGISRHSSSARGFPRRTARNSWSAYSLITFIAILAFGCSDPQVGRDQWYAMTLAEKRVVIESCMGHQKAVEAKGGAHWKPSMEVDDYVRKIEAAYRLSDDRTVEEIFQEVAHAPDTGPGDGQH